MDILSDAFFPGRIYHDSFLHGKPRDRPREYPKLEQGQRLNLPPMPHARFNKIPDRTHYRNDMQFGDGSDWATFPVMKLTNQGWVQDYDGVAMYGNCGNHASLDISINDFIYKCLFETDATQPSNTSTLMGRDNTNSRARLMMNIAGNLVFYIRDVEEDSVLKTTVNTYNDGKWYHMILVRTSTWLRGYVDTNLVIDEDASAVDDIDISSDLTIGIITIHHFNGIIAQAIIKALAETAAKQLDDYWRQA